MKKEELLSGSKSLNREPEYKVNIEDKDINAINNMNDYLRKKNKQFNREHILSIAFTLDEEDPITVFIIDDYGEMIMDSIGESIWLMIEELMFDYQDLYVIDYEG